MSTRDSWKLLVFRDGRRVRNGRELLHGLVRQVECVQSYSDFTSQFSRDEVIDALLRSGELECALADQQSCEAQASTLAAITDTLARAAVGSVKPTLGPQVLQQISEMTVPERLTVSTPEGFCYYALHPLDYVDLLSENKIDIPAAAVIGIRSIGTTLSAIVRAWFEANGTASERITVRPEGHPFDRTLTFDGTQRGWIAKQQKRGAQFFVVDEGPGLSGSSFLAVAEALVDAGVASNRIVLLPSSIPDLPNLFAPNAAARWSRFRTLTLNPTRRIPPDAAEFVGGGEWRKYVFACESEWPAVWPWTERQKYLSPDKRNIYRFDGHGRYGKEVRHRSEILAGHGWGPEVASAGDGFSASPWLEGARPRRADQNVTTQLARYCAFRAEHFACDAVPQTEIEQMAQINLERGLGVSSRIELPIKRPVIADARMMPYEWILSPQGRLLKFDAASHGDDHFYPGPTDIAWDLAGVIVEWQLTPEQTHFLIEEYEHLTSDFIRKRISTYLGAYCVFRLALTASARLSCANTSDAARLERESSQYRTELEFLINRLTASVAR
ncbi:MAG TPA: hypothetical protein VM912_15580 [Terriglobales bacterium]|nr:hypothetical protein [Terriglobales bacterium]